MVRDAAKGRNAGEDRIGLGMSSVEVLNRTLKKLLPVYRHRQVRYCTRVSCVVLLAAADPRGRELRRRLQLQLQDSVDTTSRSDYLK
jgi:hypothetical protein